MKKFAGALWFQVMIGMVAGIVAGMILSPSGLGLLTETAAEAVAPWIALPGNLFLSLIKMVVIPLVLSSIILGITSSEDTAFLKKISGRIFPYFILTTTVATSIGAGAALIFAPGKYINADLVANVMDGSPMAGGAAPAAQPLHIADRLVEMIPTNYIQSALNQDMLATVILALFVGVAIAAAGRDKMDPLTNLIQAVQVISMKIVEWAMKLAPVAVFGLICNITVRVGFEAIAGMAAYMGTVVLGLFILLLFYFLIVGIIGQISPWQFLRKVGSVQMLAFSTSSSAATMPLAMTTAEEKLGVDAPTARFIIPLGATINMDGTALYQVCATVFLCQVYGVELGFFGLLGVMVTTVGASIGTPSTPGVGIVILATILQGIGVPPSGIALIIGVDRILDMIRTMVNVTGDLVASVVMNRLLRSQPGLVPAAAPEYPSQPI